MNAADNFSVIARAFVEARKSRVALAEYPGERPTGLGDAYRIQDAALAIWDRPVGGWKVGRIRSPEAERLGANRLAGPIFTDSILVAGDSLVSMPVFVGGFAAAESEFMFALTIPAAGNLPQTDEQTLEWVSEVRIGIEIASSPYARVNADGPCVTASDHGNNNGLLLGPIVPRDKWLSLADVEIETRINGTGVGQTSAATMLDGPLGAVRFVLANLKSRGIEPRVGWWISSGAVTGVHEIAPGDSVSAHFEGLGDVACEICAA